MKKREKKLRLMTALMLGATVFLPTKKALGMVDDVGNTEADRKNIKTVTYKKAAAKQVLAGDTFVNSTLCSAANVVLKHLSRIPVIKETLVDSLQALYAGGIGKVMARESTFKPDLSNEELLALINQGLQKISLAKDDPYDRVMIKQIYVSPAFGQKNRQDELKSIMGDRSAIEGLFASKLFHVMEETPHILNSFLANLPQTEKEKLAQNSCTEKFAHYFTSLNIVDGWVPTAPILNYREKQLLNSPEVEYNIKLTKAAEVYGVLLQREKNLSKSKPSAERETASAPSSSSPAVSPSSPGVSSPLQQMFRSDLTQTLAKRNEAKQTGPSSSMPLPPTKEAIKTDSRPSSSRASELEPAPSPSSSSSIHSAKTSLLTPGDVSFNSTFKTEGGSSLPHGWTLHDGRKGRIGEERTAQNPLLVEIIGSGKIKITGDMYNYFYSLPELKNFAGQEMRFSAKVKSTVPGTRLAYVGKNGNQINSAPHSNREGEETMSLTFKVDSDPTSLNKLYFLGGRAKEGIPPYMEIQDVELVPLNPVAFNSTFEAERGSPVPQGWTLHDGRKGRIGEERTQENPLGVNVIGAGKIKITGDMYNFYYHLPDLKNFAGQEMRFSAKVKSTVPGTRLAYIGKKGTQINSDPHSNREGEETMSFTFVVDSGQASLNNLYFLGGRAKEGIPPSMEISDVKLEPIGKKN